MIDFYFIKFCEQKKKLFVAESCQKNKIPITSWLSFCLKKKVQVENIDTLVLTSSFEDWPETVDST